MVEVVPTWLGLTRPRWASVAGYAAILSFLFLLVAILVFQYIWQLIAFFMAFLCFFHWVYFRSEAITQAQVRLIDYPYLLAAGVGILLLANQGARDRAAYDRALDEIAATTRPQQLKGIVERSISQLCAPAPDRKRYDEYCTWARDIAAFLGAPYTQAQLIHKIRESEALFRASWWRIKFELWALLPEPPSGEGLQERGDGTVLAQADARTIIDFLNAIRERQETRISALPPQAEGQTDLNEVFYRFILWPFVFAFALALRLTKVTADVTDWAKR